MKPKTLTRLPLAGLAGRPPAKPSRKRQGSMAGKVVVRKNWRKAKGEKFGRLTVLSLHSRDRRYHAKLLCRCDCGKEKVVLASHLKTGSTSSCGCLHIDAITKHGHCAGGMSKLYNARQNMLNRCFGKNPRHKHYRRKGIKICSRWLSGEGRLSGFECFAKDMGEPPSKHHTIERKNNAGNYTPDNCCWSTKTEQQNNTDYNVRIKAFGVTKTLSQWARQTGIPNTTLRHRLGIWSIEKSLTEPLGKTGCKYK